MKSLALTLLLLPGAAAPSAGAHVLIEAETFQQHGGWTLDPQFLESMGSPYLLAHGLGRPVLDAKTTVLIPQSGDYRVWVRTMDWVPSHHPGRFQVLIDGQPLEDGKGNPAQFGNQGPGWLWQDGGHLSLAEGPVQLALRDLTGFDGRCDAVYLTTDLDVRPPNQAGPAMTSWRRELRGFPRTPSSAGQF